MAKLTSDQVKHVAKLAKLQLSDKELKRFLDQLTKVIDYVDELSEVDTSKVDPTSQTTGLTDITRKDAIKPFQTLPVEDAVNQAKEEYNNYFLVPAVIDKDTT